MFNVVKAELRKMKRPSLTLVTFSIVTALSALFTSLIFLRLGKPSDHPRGKDMAQSVESMAHSDGAYYSFTLMGLFIGLIALTVFASQSSNEYTYGTLRNLLVRQPSRMKLLAGKFLAMSIFATVLTTVAAIANISLSYIESGYSDVDTKLWLSSKAISGFSTAFGNMVLGTIGYGVVGMSLGIILKSPMSAISISLLWFMVLENILGAVLSSASKWLPGNSLSAVSTGGAKVFTYERGLILSGCYLLLFGGIATILFKRRDVAS